MHAAEPAEPAPIKLPRVLDLAGAASLHRQLQEAWASRESRPAAAPVLDGAVVERVSTAALQLLVASARRASARGLKRALHQPSPMLRAAIEDLGLTGEFSDGDAV
jgi:anti-anti-sigma regulatory factor